MMTREQSAGEVSELVGILDDGGRGCWGGGGGEENRE